MQTDEALMVSNSQHCGMLHVAGVGPCAPCYMLLRLVGSCSGKFETVQTFSHVWTEATTPRDVASVSKNPKIWVELCININVLPGLARAKLSDFFKASKWRKTCVEVQNNFAFFFDLQFPISRPKKRGLPNNFPPKTCNSEGHISHQFTCSRRKVDDRYQDAM